MPKNGSYAKMSYEHELMGNAPAGKEMKYINMKYGGKGIKPVMNHLEGTMTRTHKAKGGMGMNSGGGY